MKHNLVEPPCTAPYARWLFPDTAIAPDFDWRDVNIVVREQAAIAVYANPNDDVVIRQAGTYGIDEDVWITVNRENPVPLISALQRFERGEE